jgi:CheY-like chemotaxis protein
MTHARARLEVVNDPFESWESADPSTSVPILVVDDNAAKRSPLRAVLRPLGHAIVEAESGLAALRSVMTHDFAVILLDVRMAVMDGFETAALIRTRQVAMFANRFRPSAPTVP